MSAQLTRERGARRPSLAAQATRLFGRFTAIMLGCAVVIGATILLAHSAAGPSITNAMAPAVAKPGGAPKPSATAPADRSSQAGESSQPAQAAAPAGRPQAGAPGGRNVPSLTRGMPDLLKYGGIMAGATLAVVLVLRARRPRPRLEKSVSRRAVMPGS